MLLWIYKPVLRDMGVLFIQPLAINTPPTNFYHWHPQSLCLSDCPYPNLTLYPTTTLYHSPIYILLFLIYFIFARSVRGFSPAARCRRSSGCLSPAARLRRSSDCPSSAVHCPCWHGPAEMLPLTFICLCVHDLFCRPAADADMLPVSNSSILLLGCRCSAYDAKLPVARRF